MYVYVSLSLSLKFLNEFINSSGRSDFRDPVRVSNL